MRKRRRKDQIPNKRPHLKVYNTQLGALKRETQNLGPKPIINNTKQVGVHFGQSETARHKT